MDKLVEATKEAFQQEGEVEAFVKGKEFDKMEKRWEKKKSTGGKVGTGGATGKKMEKPLNMEDGEGN